MRIRKKKFPSVIPGTFRVLYFAKFTHVTSGFATEQNNEMGVCFDVYFSK